MTLNEAFAHAMKNDSISHLEMSWSMGITQERLTDLLNGAEYNQQEELEMFRFVFKMKKKSMLMEVPASVPSLEKMNGI